MVACSESHKWVGPISTIAKKIRDVTDFINFFFFNVNGELKLDIGRCCQTQHKWLSDCKLSDAFISKMNTFLTVYRYSTSTTVEFM